MSISKKLGVSSLVATLVTFVATSAFAQEAGGSNLNDVKSYAAMAAGCAIGLGVLGGALGQGRAAAAALEGISRNPGAAAKIQTPMILGLALIESLVLLAFVIARALRAHDARILVTPTPSNGERRRFRFLGAHRATLPRLRVLFEAALEVEQRVDEPHERREHEHHDPEPLVGGDGEPDEARSRSEMHQDRFKPAIARGCSTARDPTGQQQRRLVMRFIIDFFR